MGYAILIFLGGLAIFLIAFAYGVLSWGLVTYYYYYWFLLPVFEFLPEITFLEAIGVSFFISLFKNITTNNSRKSEEQDNTQNAIQHLIAPWLALFVGWLYHIIFLI